jgi:Family of unknown function (DUF6152)
MKRRFAAVLGVGLGMAFLSGGVSAHHGASVVYDLGTSITVSGVVTKFDFVNPHVLIFFNVTGPDGQTVEWSAGLTSPNRLARTDSWSRNTFKPGDQITVTGNPARSGAPSIWVQKVKNGDRELLGVDES